jgi:hypothetical protein
MIAISKKMCYNEEKYKGILCECSQRTAEEAFSHETR